jgi:hypothetical protein
MVSGLGSWLHVRTAPCGAHTADSYSHAIGSCPHAATGSSPSTACISSHRIHSSPCLLWIRSSSCLRWICSSSCLAGCVFGEGLRWPWEWVRASVEGLGGVGVGVDVAAMRATGGLLALAGQGVVHARHGVVARVVHSIGKSCSSSFASQVLLLLLLLKC